MFKFRYISDFIQYEHYTPVFTSFADSYDQYARCSYLLTTVQLNYAVLSRCLITACTHFAIVGEARDITSVMKNSSSVFCFMSIGS